MINNVFVDETNHIYIAMTMHNLIEYSDNYSETPGSLWQFKRDDVPIDKTANHNGGKSSVKDVKIVVPFKYLSNFWTSLEIPLINCKGLLELS